MIDKKINFTKKNISKEIEIKIGYPNSYVSQVINDFIDILKHISKEKKLNIKNFGTFKVLNKKERLGRNPKNKKVYKIEARKALSFVSSNSLNKKINDG